MKVKLLVLIMFCPLWLCAQTKESQGVDSIMIKEIHNHILSQGKSYTWLTYITKEIGARLSGSKENDKMVEYTRKEMKTLGLDSLWLEPVMVPKWVRGAKEEAYILSQNKKIPVEILALGGSIATPENGIQAKVIEVQGLEDLKKLGKEEVSGKVIFFNRPMDPTIHNTFTAYREAADQRSTGPRIAAKYGAVAVIVH